MVGGYKPWPRTAQAFWVLSVLWLLGGVAYAVFPRSSPAPSPPFHVTAGGSVFQFFPLPPHSVPVIVVVYQSMYGPTISPVLLLVYLSVLNAQAIPSTPESYVVEGIGDPIPIPLEGKQLYWLGKGPHEAIKMLVDPLSANLGRTLKPHETVSG
jgi:hypothetical protein